MEETKQQIDARKMVILNAVRYIIQTEIADRVWYQDRGCDEQLQKGLSSAENKLVEYISERFNQLSKLHEESKREMLEKVKTLLLNNVITIQDHGQYFKKDVFFNLDTLVSDNEEK